MKTALEPELELGIPIRNLGLRGDLILPENAIGLVLFAHGSGSGRKSSRNRFVASVLHKQNVGTLLFDLLTEDEEALDSRTAHLRLDIPLLADRLLQVTEWIRREKSALPIGYFGASTGAAAALIAAAQLGPVIRAVVSRGGRPDLAHRELPNVQSPTLLIVGSRDLPVIDMNQSAYAQLRCEKRFEIVPGASHLFEEPGTLELAANLAADWFNTFLPPADSR
jgi:pimeloyl-ACP methyl ester carboxylesterase